MHIAVDRAVDTDGVRYRWRLIRRHPHGADLVARGVDSYPDRESCYRAVGLLADPDGDTTPALHLRGGGWRWVVRGPDGAPLAESPAVYRDAATCAHALAEVREAARELIPFAGTRLSGGN